MIGAGLVFGAVVTIAGLMPTYLTYALMTPLIGLSALTLITSANAYMQLHTEAGMRGRVMALYMMIFIGGTPFGAPLIGWVGEAYGARWTLLVGSILTFATALLLGVRLGKGRDAGHDPLLESGPIGFGFGRRSRQIRIANEACQRFAERVTINRARSRKFQIITHCYPLMSFKSPRSFCRA